MPEDAHHKTEGPAGNYCPAEGQGCLRQLGICSKNYDLASLHCREVSQLSPMDIWGEIINDLWQGPSWACSAGSLTFTHQMPIAPSPRSDHQKCVQTWPNMSCKAKSPPR